jgi:hypothetical protein
MKLYRIFKYLKVFYSFGAYYNVNYIWGSYGFIKDLLIKHTVHENILQIG